MNRNEAQEQALTSLLEKLDSVLPLLSQMVRDKRINGSLYVGQIESLLNARNEYSQALKIRNDL